MADVERVALVTGATSGIGRAAAARLVAAGYRVVGVGRDRSRGTAAVEAWRGQVPGARVDVVIADLADPDAVRRLAAHVLDRYPRLDLLVHGAAVVRPRRELTPAGLEVTFATNHLAPFLLTALLRDRLTAGASARVVTVGSSAHRQVRAVPWDGLATGADFHRLRTYGVTKLLNVLFTTELARRLTGTGVTANCADPGFVRTALGRDATGAFGLFLRVARPFQASPDKGARTVVHLALSPDVRAVTGGYFANARPRAASDLATDPAVAARLWRLSEELTGVVSR